MRRSKLLGLIAALIAGSLALAAPVQAVTLTNVSYDPTRELPKGSDAAFGKAAAR